MSRQDRTRWEQRHEREMALAPRESVLSIPRTAPPGAVALDLACGQGRHSRCILEAGYLVVSTDISINALRVCRRTLGAGSLVIQADIDDWPFAEASFDLIVQVDFLDRRLFPSLHACLRPGGLLLIDTFLDQGRRNDEGPSRPAFLLCPGELPRAFGDLSVVRYDEIRGATARAIFLGRKRR